MRIPTGPAAVLIVLLVMSCGTEEPSADEPSDPIQLTIDPDGESYAPDIRPEDFVDEIDNQYLPLPPAARWVYEGVTEDGEAVRIEVEVTDERRDVMGVATTVVRDTEFIDGELAEDTFDWFAQDTAGNVWYFGEETAEYEHGEIVSTEGAWEAGVDGALPGIVMPASPDVGQAFRQEYYPGEAEDMGEVIATGVDLSVPAGEFTDVITTKDWTPLEPGVEEEKFYAPGVGLLREVATDSDDDFAELVEYTMS